MRFLGRSLTGLLLLALALAALVQAGALVGGAVRDRMAEEPRETPTEERVFAVELVTVRAGTETPLLRAFGTVQTRRALDLQAAAAGRVIALGDGVAEGAQVAAGDLLFRLDPAEAEAALARARADLADAASDATEARNALALALDERAAARDQVDLRERALERQRDLSTRGVGAVAALEDAELALSAARQTVLARRQAIAAAEARIDRAETARARATLALDEARRALDDTEMRAPFAGTVAALDAVVGRRVAPGDRLARLVDTAALEVAFRVSTVQHSRLLGPTGDLDAGPVTAEIAGDGLTLRATGTLAREAAEVGEAQTGRLLFADLDAAPGFRPGDFVTVTVQEPPLSDVARLPSGAIGPDGTVLVVGDDDRLDTAPVDILRRQGDSVLVRAAALEGRQVVAQRTPLLGRGTRVRPLDANADAVRDEAAAPAPAAPDRT